MQSESVISEAVLNRALRQDVLYMLMTLPHIDTLTDRAGPASFSDKALLPPAVMLGYVAYCYHDNSGGKESGERTYNASANLSFF